MTRIAIGDVEVVGRFRRDLGDISTLAESMRDLGQLQPIVLAPGRRLVAGGRRLAAAQSLGWTEIDAITAGGLDDAAALLRAERDENTCRKSFTLSEEHALYQELLGLEHSRLTHRTPEAGSGSTDDGTAAIPSRARQAASAVINGSGGRYKTLERVGEVKRVAEDKNWSPRLRDLANDALVEMDRTGNATGPHTRVMLALRAEESSKSTGFESWSPEERTLLSMLQDGETIVVSLRECHRNLVQWARTQGLLVTVDRQTEWGNPFELPHDGDRATVIANYAEHYLPHKPSLKERLHELKGKALACWCAPEPCHADVLKLEASRM